MIKFVTALNLCLKKLKRDTGNVKYETRLATNMMKDSLQKVRKITK